MRLAAVVALVLLIAAGGAAAQDSTAAQAPVPDSAAATPVSADTARAGPADSVPAARPPVTPMGAFWRSLLIPGWGQARTGRRTAAAFFLAAEGVTLGMTLTTSSQLRYAQETDAPNTESKSQQREDWLVLLGFNHLMAALEAYVSAHLWDFPGDLTIQATPGGVAGSLSVPVRLP